ncbi:CD302 antigen isoform X1 [Carcharodon carcharias]|uniref:CD302 antigen isoform X1 n=1 Tax=Carcharodon carcharias TaxID=13397 RepID=UPI001B7D9E4B|nr:CD302 antigen isoform X1 [Carcharodon carcharias]
MDVRKNRAFHFVYLIAGCLSSLSSANQLECDFDSGITWIPFGSKWYTFISTPGNGYEMSKAQEMCKESAPGANIICILNEKENKFIADQFNRTAQSGTIWLGMVFDTDSNTMKWFDQSEVSFSNWAPGEPSGGTPDVDTCTVMDTKSGQWKVASCDEGFGKSVICETTIIAVPDGEKCSRGNKNNVLPTALLITAAAILAIISIVTWYAYKRKHLAANGFNSIQHNPTDQVTDDSVLVENEEREYVA